MASDAGPRLGTKPESVDAHKGTMLDVFARCLKKKIAQVCTLLKQCANIKEEITANTIIVVTLSVDQHPKSKILTL